MNLKNMLHYRFTGKSSVILTCLVVFSTVVVIGPQVVHSQASENERSQGSQLFVFTVQVDRQKVLPLTPVWAKISIKNKTQHSVDRAVGDVWIDVYTTNRKKKRYLAYDLKGTHWPGRVYSNVMSPPIPKRTTWKAGESKQWFVVINTPSTFEPLHLQPGLSTIDLRPNRNDNEYIKALHPLTLQVLEPHNSDAIAYRDLKARAPDALYGVDIIDTKSVLWLKNFIHKHKKSIYQDYAGLLLGSSLMMQGADARHTSVQDSEKLLNDVIENTKITKPTMSARALYYMGAMRMTQHRYEKASTYFTIALHSHPDIYYMHLLMQAEKKLADISQTQTIRHVESKQSSQRLSKKDVAELKQFIQDFADAIETRDVKKFRQFYPKGERGTKLAQRTANEFKELQAGKLNIQFTNIYVRKNGSGNYQVNTQLTDSVDGKVYLKNAKIVFEVGRENGAWRVFDMRQVSNSKSGKESQKKGSGVK